MRLLSELESAAVVGRTAFVWIVRVSVAIDERSGLVDGVVYKVGGLVVDGLGKVSSRRRGEKLAMLRRRCRWRKTQQSRLAVGVIWWTRVLGPQRRPSVANRVG